MMVTRRGIFLGSGNPPPLSRPALVLAAPLRKLAKPVAEH
jgi:hypothetical protein